MNQTILLVDDEKGILDVLGKFLIKEGFRVLATTKGNEALAIAKEHMPDLIILDVMLPDTSGGEVAESIRDDVELRNIPIVFLTGLISDNESTKYNNSNTGRLILSKSVDIKEQVGIIKSILNVK